ncbi:MAG TPA: FAD-dependent oxidoreductase [Chitinophagaceae bacterium]|nr:FAD-dependent oxidoreductase [Chitinophagaceae bacterium]
MRRDGAQTSLWQAQIPDFEPKNTADFNGQYDVVLVGGGMTGVVTGLLLQKAGLKCLIAEAYTLCFGTTGGTTAHLNTFFDNDYHQMVKDFGETDAQLVAGAAQRAVDLVRENVTQYNIDCGFEDRDGFVYAQDDKQAELLQDILKASKKVGVTVKETDIIPVLVPFQQAIVYHGQAQFHPTKYVLALASEFEKAGGVIVQQCRVTDVKDAQDLGLIVESEKGNIKARNVIYATHIPPNINVLHFRCAPYRSYAMAVTLKDGAYPEGLAYDMYDPYHYYRTQEVDGKKYLIAGGEDHKTAHETNTEECFRHLESHLSKYFNVDEIAYKWSSQYYEPADGLAYIGHLPGAPSNVFVATGYGGNGMTYSHIAAITLSEILTGRDSDFIEVFDPARVKMVAGFSAFVKENADVVAKFFGMRIGQDKITALAELAPGEAKVVKYNGDSIALYKDDNGNLHAVNPVCTHAKCIVAWNNAEKTWDCPCHGARYDASGKVLTGPARKDLEVVPLR